MIPSDRVSRCGTKGTACGVNTVAKTANLEDERTTIDTAMEAEDEQKRESVSAAVSEKFRNAVEDKASEVEATVSSFLAYHLALSVGITDAEMKKDRTAEKWILSTQVSPEVKAAIKAKADAGKMKITEYLRKVAADAVGYDLKDEPARLPGGGGAYIRDLQAKYQERTNSLVRTFTKLQAILPREQFEEAMNDAGTSYEELGLSPVEA